MCRKKKIRCQPVSDTCAQCIKYKTVCHFTPVSVTRRPKRIVRYDSEELFVYASLILPRDKKIEELEMKLKWTEGQLKLAIDGWKSDSNGSQSPSLGAMLVPGFGQSRVGTPLKTLAAMGTYSSSSASNMIQESAHDIQVSHTLALSQQSEPYLLYGVPADRLQLSSLEMQHQGVFMRCQRKKGPWSSLRSILKGIMSCIQYFMKPLSDVRLTRFTTRTMTAVTHPGGQA